MSKPSESNPFHGQREIRAMLPNDYEAIKDLSPTQIKAVRDWCKHLEPSDKMNYRHSSYGLKHMCERDLEFYVPNGIIKQIMNELGYKMVDKYSPNGINEFYNISEKSIKIDRQRE